MSTPLNESGIEVYVGPRGHSVVNARASQDGSSVIFQTDQPKDLNPVKLPRGPKGDQGDQGDPGQARIRVDNTVGRRVFLWDATTAREQLVAGDTGTWLLPDGTTWVRRSGLYTVETNAADPTTLPAGFRPAEGATGQTGHYQTADPWPEAELGTRTAPPSPLEGLEGYQAALAGGYPGTAEQWMDMVYRVVLPPAGTAGQVLTRTDEGSDWRDLPTIGASPWEAINLDQWAPSAQHNSGALVRMNNGTVELYGLWTYQGPTVTVGAYDFLRIGVLPPAYAPEHGVDIPITSYREYTAPAPGGQTASMARLVISTQGVMSLSAISVGNAPASFTAKANIAQVNVSAVSFALRNSSPRP